MAEQAAVNKSRLSVNDDSQQETNPLAHIAGSYADDPFWDEFVQLMEESRQAMDAVTEPAE